MTEKLLSKPIILSANVIKGFGRGGKLLNCPTANLDLSEHPKVLENIPCGVYYGWARLEGKTYKTVASIGWNPTFENKVKTVEPHLIHNFTRDFYGKTLDVIFCGFLRDELKFDGIESLSKQIQKDIVAAKVALDEPKALSFCQSFSSLID
eukprot:snap_masked-scaffold_37-processed-gene-2.51-mRNA-1 protein AED:0.39 eAED:0.39 QI:0/-1/0/1/-1/1/1/0/150